MELCQLTVSTGLHRSFNITDAFNRESVLVVAIHELVFQLANLVDQHTQLVGYVRDIVVTAFAPERQLLLGKTTD